MKSLLSLLALVLVAGNLACSSAPKQQEEAEASAAAESTEVSNAAADLEESTSKEAAPVTLSESTPATAKSDLSLGAGSSGRGH